MEIFYWIIWRYQRGNHYTLIKKGRQHNSQAKKDKRTRIKEHTMVYKTPHRNLMIEQHEPARIPGMNSGSRKGQQFLSSSGTRRVTFVTRPMLSNEWGKVTHLFSDSNVFNLTLHMTLNLRLCGVTLDLCWHTEICHPPPPDVCTEPMYKVINGEKCKWCYRIVTCKSSRSIDSYMRG